MPASDPPSSSSGVQDEAVPVIEADEILLPGQESRGHGPRAGATGTRSGPGGPGAGVTPPELRSVVSRFLAWLLDDAIRVPGTRFRFGLDPIIGLIPGGGETIASLLGLYLLGDGARRGLPLRTVAKMAGNMLLNAGVGAIPVVGDIFSLWFKSNARNYALIKQWTESDDGRQAEGGWWPLAIVGGTIGLVLALNILAWVFFIWCVRQVLG